MLYRFESIQEGSAREILSWRYEAPYDYYNPDPSRVEHIMQHFLDHPHAYYAVRDGGNGVIGFCCFGSEGQVPGGDYSDAALDLGLGLRPNLTGKGNGSSFLASILAFTSNAYSPETIRLAVAAFNERAIRLYENAGFRRTLRFLSRLDGTPFIMMDNRAGR